MLGCLFVDSCDCFGKAYIKYGICGVCRCTLIVFGCFVVGMLYVCSIVYTWTLPVWVPCMVPLQGVSASPSLRVRLAPFLEGPGIFNPESPPKIPCFTMNPPIKIDRSCKYHGRQGFEFVPGDSVGLLGDMGHHGFRITS